LVHPPTQMATQDGPPPAVFVLIFGPIFWGFCVSLALSGITISQGFLYFTRYSDRPLIRGLAASMLVLDLLSNALITQSVYYYMLPSYGSLGPLGAVTRELDIDCGISSIIAFISQMFFVYQLVIVKSNSKTAQVMNVAIVVSGTISLGASIGCVVVMFKHPGSIFMHRTLAFNILAGMHKANGAIADVLATTAMVMFLKTADTGIHRTSSLLRSLVVLVVNRGLLVTLAQFVGLVVLFASTTHLYWVAVHINTTRLYVATFFAMLNSRTPPESATPHINISGARRDSFEVSKFPDYHSGGGIGVRVHTSSTVAEI